MLYLTNKHEVHYSIYLGPIMLEGSQKQKWALYTEQHWSPYNLEGETFKGQCEAQFTEINWKLLSVALQTMLLCSHHRSGCSIWGKSCIRHWQFLCLYPWIQRTITQALTPVTSVWVLSILSPLIISTHIGKYHFKILSLKQLALLSIHNWFLFENILATHPGIKFLRLFIQTCQCCIAIFVKLLASELSYFHQRYRERLCVTLYQHLPAMDLIPLHPNKNVSVWCPQKLFQSF